MKTWKFVWIVAVLMAGAVYAQSGDGLRTLKTRAGLSFRARIVDYDPVAERFLLEQEDHSRSWVGASEFRMSEGKYLREWLKSYDVLFGKALAVTVNTREGPLTNAVPGEVGRKKKREYSTVVSLKKQTADPIDGFRVEYRCFLADAAVVTNLVEMTVTNLDTTAAGVDEIATNLLVTVTNVLVEATNLSNPRQIGGELVVTNLQDGQVLEFSTEPLELTGEYDWRMVMGLFGGSYQDVPLREERVLGFWLKVYGSGPHGIPIVRDVCKPKDLYEQVVWSNGVPLLAVLPAGAP